MGEFLAKMLSDALGKIKAEAGHKIRSEDIFTIYDGEFDREFYGGERNERDSDLKPKPRRHPLIFQGQPVNCYPGYYTGQCCEIAIFISLSSPAYIAGRGHLSCRQAMEKIVQHAQGSCRQITRHIVFLTDSWDAAAFDDWGDNLEEIANSCRMEVYLVSDRFQSRIDVG